MRLTLGFSPCPNDTFIFDALVHHKIDTEGLKFDLVIEDIERLNHLALAEKLDVTKLSYNAFRYCAEKYVLLDSGSALGRECGPLLIKNKETVLSKESKIAIPGEYTTANMLLNIIRPDFQNKVIVLFSDIEQSILNYEVDAGVIIHENRFTYQQKGLVKVEDLGELWQERTSLPIPLGGIVVKRNILFETQKRIERVLRRSIEYAMENHEESIDFIRSHSQEMKKEIVDAHINLYVNEFSVSLGKEGRRSIERIFLESKIQNSDIFLSD